MSGERRSAKRLLRVRDRSLEITAAGWIFIALTLAVGFAAINSGSNLLHAIFGAQMTLIIGSGLLSEATVRRVVAERLVPHAVHAGIPASLRVELRNSSREADLLSISIEDAASGVDAGTCRPVFVLRLPAGGHRSVQSQVTMPKRGVHPLPPAVISTRFPFGLFVKRRHLAATQQVLVYPRVHAVDLAAVRDAAAHEGQSGERLAREGEFRGLRDYHEGDDPRRIHWGATARRGRPVVRELEAGHAPVVVLEVRPGKTGDPTFEEHVEDVASRAAAFLAEPGWSVGLRQGSTMLIPPGTGETQRHAVLELLARHGEAD